MDLKETDILGDSIGEHWYYCSKAAATRRLLGATPIKRILDVGAGSGFFSHHLLTHTGALEAWCVDISYPADSNATTVGKPVHYLRGIESSDADLVLLMDVLEHVDDDLGLPKGPQAQMPQSQLKRHHPLVNTLLKTLCKLELPLMGINRLAGLSVFVLAVKP